MRLSAQGLANVAWAFATASQRDAPLFAVLARAAERRMGDFSLQDVANSAWASAMRISSHGLAYMAWAFATASQRNAPLFAALARAAERRMGDFSLQDVANSAWGSAMGLQLGTDAVRG